MLKRSETMRRIITAFLLVLLAGGLPSCVNEKAQASPVHSNATDKTNLVEDKTEMKITVTANEKITVYELNSSQAAKDLYNQLPMTIEVQDYSTDEKIFYPPEKLNTVDTPRANAKTGTLAYYAPWGDVVMFYKDFGTASGLYELGTCVSGEEYIREMSGIIKIEKQ